MSDKDTECFAGVLEEHEFFTEAKHMREQQATIKELEADGVEVRKVTGNYIRSLKAQLGEANTTIISLKACISNDENWRKAYYDRAIRAEATIEELTSALKGIGGGSVYRKSHEHISKELEAVRRFARAALKENTDAPR